MPNLIAIANFIGTNLRGINPPQGGSDIITEINTSGTGISLQMVTEINTGVNPKEDLITEKLI